MMTWQNDTGFRVESLSRPRRIIFDNWLLWWSMINRRRYWACVGGKGEFICLDKSFWVLGGSLRGLIAVYISSQGTNIVSEDIRMMFMCNLTLRLTIVDVLGMGWYFLERFVVYAWRKRGTETGFGDSSNMRSDQGWCWSMRAKLK